MAALNGNVEVFKFLMNAGSDATKLGFHGKTVFHYAAAKGHKELLNFMIFEALRFTYNSYFTRKFVRIRQK